MNDGISGLNPKNDIIYLGKNYDYGIIGQPIKVSTSIKNENKIVYTKDELLNFKYINQKPTIFPDMTFVDEKNTKNKETDESFIEKKNISLEKFENIKSTIFKNTLLCKNKETLDKIINLIINSEKMIKKNNIRKLSLNIKQIDSIIKSLG